MDQFAQSLVTILCLASIAIIFAGILYLVMWRLNRNIKTFVVMNQGNSKPIEGIPFYIKKSRLVHETSYLEPLVILTVTARTIVLDDKEKPVRVVMAYTNVKTVPLHCGNVEAVAEFNQSMAEAQQGTSETDQAEHWKTAKHQFEGLPSYAGQEPGANTLPVESNIIRDSAYVDYNDKYYLNKLQPISGSSELSIELASDGTLSKASGKSEDKAFESILGVLPLGSSASQSTTAPTTTADQPKAEAEYFEPRPGEKIRYEFSLVAENFYIRHIYSDDTVEKRAFQKPLMPGSEEHWYRREVLASLKSDAEKPAAKSEAKNKDTATKDKSKQE